MGRSRAKGTSWESAVVAYLRAATGDAEGTIRRKALHGACDEGDVDACAHGHRGVLECKSHARYGHADLARWLAETEDERVNADAAWAALVVHEPGTGGTAASPTMGLNPSWLTLASLEVVSGVGLESAWSREHRDDTWVSVDLSTLARMMTWED